MCPSEVALPNSAAFPKIFCRGQDSDLPVAEVFKSLQGEGFLTGTESLFIRVSGCNLRCWFCDTRYSSWEPEGKLIPVGELLSVVEETGCTHVVVTGGEPMLFPAVVTLTEGLRRLGSHVTIETSGTIYRPVFCNLMSVSPKLSNSTPPAERYPWWARAHEQRRHNPEVIRRLLREFSYQIKFVIDKPADLAEVESYLREFPEIERRRVLLMPQGTQLAELEAKRSWLEPYCREKGLHFCPRRHIEWFGGARGK